MSRHCRKPAAGPRARHCVADILIGFHQAYLHRYGDTITPCQRKALQSILLCRTEPMGGRRYRCEHCRRDHFAWHSCNHRLCPRCGAAETADWVAAKLENLLPVDHYMVTFTLPVELRELCHRQAEVFYKLFFACSAQAIKDVLKQPRHLGGQCGFFGMLQSWTRELTLHPHIHFIVPAVALAQNGRLKRPKNPGWLARGDVFASRLRTLLLGALGRENPLPAGRINELRAISWNCDVVNFGCGKNAIKYLGAYVRKGPISDCRILGADRQCVTIAVRDRTSGEQKALTIDGVEFVRRYLQHALPTGFHRLRYYGFLHPRARLRLASVRAQLPVPKEIRPVEATPAEPPPVLCPRCKAPMKLIGKQSRAPPHLRTIRRIWTQIYQAAA